MPIHRSSLQYLASGERDINEIAKKVSALNDIVSADTFKEQFSTFKRVANISKDVDLESELKHRHFTFQRRCRSDILYNAYEKVINATLRMTIKHRT